MGTSHNLTEPAAPQRAPASSPTPWRIADLLHEASTRLGSPHAAAARLDAELLLAQVLHAPRSALIARSGEPIEAAAAQQFMALVARREAGEPLAYLSGEREFWSLPVRVNPAVLIPRPETELLVERVLALLDEAPAAATPAARVADLGTGSGAIALALASARPQWQLTATDVSAPALELARSNAARLDLRGIEFLAGSWFAALGTRRFEAIVSNPPDVAGDDPALRALRFEPALALTPGPSGLEALRQLIAQAPAHLATGAWLVLEHAANQAPAVAAALVAGGYARVRCHRDLAGCDRVTEGCWPR